VVWPRMGTAVRRAVIHDHSRATHVEICTDEKVATATGRHAGEEGLRNRRFPTAGLLNRSDPTEVSACASKRAVADPRSRQLPLHGGWQDVFYGVRGRRGN
jgi:hypothetical protein